MELPLAYYVQTSLTGLAILALIYLHCRRQYRGRQRSESVYRWALGAVAALNVLELLLNLLTGVRGTAPRVVLATCVFMFYSLNPVPEALWVCYLYALVRREEKFLSGFWVAVGVPLVINAMAAAASLLGGFTFYIDGDNVYHRGPWFALMASICYVYLAHFLALALKYRTALPGRVALSLFGFALVPILGGLVQSLCYGLSLTWLTAAFGMLILYMGIQSEQANTDSLTRLANRRLFDGWMASLGNKTGQTACFMLDVDDFKGINDRFGHDAGDRVLEVVADVLRRSVRKGDRIARIGGDEFAILMTVNGEGEAEEVAARIREYMRKANDRAHLPCMVSVSIGYGLYGGGDAGEFFRMVDSRMYGVKRGNRLDKS